jgi:hypothetical protein
MLTGVGAGSSARDEGNEEKVDNKSIESDEVSSRHDILYRLEGLRHYTLLDPKETRTAR